MSSGVLCAISGGIGLVTLDRPEVLNAVDRSMRQQLLEIMDALGCNEDVGAIVITGQGTRAFCVGGNFNDMKDAGQAEAQELISAWGKLYKCISGLDKPVVAAVNGIAVGAGFQLAMLADIRIAHPEVKLGQPEINAGMPTALGPYLMSHIAGPARAAELTLTGRLVGAAEGERLGFLHRIVPVDDVLPEALAAARELAAKPRVAMSLQKRYFAESFNAGFDAAIAAGCALMEKAYLSGVPQALIAKALGAKGGRKNL